MRCPKCGYISFDHLEICLKCNKDVSKVSDQVEGTTYQVEAPSFLRFSSSHETQVEEEAEIQFDAGQDDFNVIDPDLDILMGSSEEESTEETQLSFEDDFEDDLGGFEELAADEGFEIAPEEDSNEEESGIDLGQFEDAFEQQDSSLGEDEVQLDLPDELADISDLSAPAAFSDDSEFSFDEPEETSDLAPEVDKEEMDDFSLNLELDDLDSDFSLSSPEEKGSQFQDDDMDIDSLSLEDIGLSDLSEETPAPQKKRDDLMDMDEDLDFNLDLGGLTLTDD